MTTVMTRDQIAAAISAATTERDGIQANLLELDGSFGKRLLDGAALEGLSKQRWEAAAAELATLWETFTAYEAAIDRATELHSRSRRPTAADLEEITAILTGKSVALSRPVPLAERSLTYSGHKLVTLGEAVQEMKRAFTSVTAVVTAAETVWDQTADGLAEVTAALDAAGQQAAQIGDPKLTADVAAATADLGRLRALLNADPLSLWQRGRTDTTPLDRIRQHAAGVAARAADLASLRADAVRRIEAARQSVALAATAWQDAAAAQRRAAALIAQPALLPLPPPARLGDRLAGLGALQQAGRWAVLAAELQVLEADASAAARQFREAEQSAAALLDRRDELRGLLDAYQAKAGRLGAAEDPELTASYRRARDLLWTSPCDLAAATAQVSGYQQAVLALSDRRQPR